MHNEREVIADPTKSVILRAVERDIPNQKLLWIRVVILLILEDGKKVVRMGSGTQTWVCQAGEKLTYEEARLYFDEKDLRERASE